MCESPEGYSAVHVSHWKREENGSMFVFLNREVVSWHSEPFSLTDSGSASSSSRLGVPADFTEEC